jgi:hypothetical protein
MIECFSIGRYFDLPIGLNISYLEKRKMINSNKDQINKIMQKYIDTEDNILFEQEIWPRLFKFCWAVYRKRRFWGLDDDIEYLTWISFKQSLDTFGWCGDFEKFLRSVAQFFIWRCKDEIEKKYRRKEESSLPLIIIEDPLENMILKEKEEQILKSIMKASKKSREALAMFCDGLKREYIERELQRRYQNPVKAKDLLYHDRKKVRKHLRDEYDWDI